MNAFIVAVPSHIINTLQIIHTEHLKQNDLYLIPATKTSEQLADRLERTGLFEHVTILKNIMVSYPVTVGQMLQVALNRFPTVTALKGKKYDNIYYSIDGWYANSIVYHGLKRLNKYANHYFLENGVNPYCRSYENKQWYLRLFINMMGMTCMDGRYITARYLYEPEAICIQQKGELRHLKKINKNDEELCAQLNMVFDYQNDAREFEGKSFILMEQGPLACKVDMQGLWLKVLSFLPKDKVILKPHPRQKNSALQELRLDLCRNYTLPWEIYTLNMDTKNKIIFSIFSTSCIAPKLVFDEEPTVILLYKLLEVDSHFLGQGIVEFVEKVGQLYRDKRKFFVPATFEELENYMKNEVLLDCENRQKFVK